MSQGQKGNTQPPTQNNPFVTAQYAGVMRVESTGTSVFQPTSGNCHLFAMSARSPDRAQFLHHTGDVSPAS